MKTLYTDARIVPMTGETDFYTVMGVEDGKIIYLGNEVPGESDPCKDSPGDVYDRKVSLSGRFVYPTLTDSHLHLLYSIILSACSFNICRMTEDGVTPDCLEGIEQEIRNYTAGHPGNGLIMINQYIPSAIREGRLPYAEELDRWTGGRETVVFNIDGHSCALSSALSEKTGLQTEKGLLIGEAYDKQQAKITDYAATKVNLNVLAKGIAAFTNTCLDFGITGVCALDGSGDCAPGKDRLRLLLLFLARRMDIDVRLFPEYMNFGILDKIGAKLRSPRLGGCGKWELDGSVGSHSAAFYHPFTDSGIKGKLYHDTEKIEKLVRKGLESGVQMSAHAIGTAAIDQIIGVYRRCELLIPEKGPMPRIDHFEFPSREAVEFVKGHRIAVTLQPGYAYLDKRCIHSYEKYLDPADLERIVPLKELADAGVTMLGSSDSPVQGVNPYEQMRGMMDYYEPSQSLSAYEAFYAYTAGPCRALGEEAGVLKEGYPANFFVSRADILHASPEEICYVRADEVYLRGKRLTRKKGTLAELFGLLLRRPAKI